MQILGIIPARYASSRFPGKPLVDINGKSMIERVYDQAKKCEQLNVVMIATDDERIFDHVKTFGGEVVMTSKHHESGTDRCAEVVSALSKKFDVVLNIQGDEPFINPNQISQLIDCFSDENTDIATLVRKIDHNDDVFDPNKVKVVRSGNNFALYFSRSPIPFVRSQMKDTWVDNHQFLKHIGIYGYRTQCLKKITELPVSNLEIAENLEQLRWLEGGYRIKVAETEYEATAIDTPEDLKKLLDSL